MRFLLTYLICCIPALLVGQNEWLNNSFALPSINPAFAVSSHAYNRVNAFYTKDGFSSLQGQINVNSIYSAFGGEVSYKDNDHYALGIRAAYHTFFTRNNYHLLIGAQPMISKFEQSFDTHFRLGIVISSSEHGKWLTGLSTWINEPTTTIADYPLQKRRWYSAQFGTAIMRLTRRSVLTLLSTCDFATKADGMQDIVRPLAYLKLNHSRYGAFSLGWRSHNFDTHDLLIRYQLTYFASMAVSYAYRLGPSNGPSNNVLELSLSYKFNLE